MPPRPEDRARETIDRQLTEAGWVVQDFRAMNLYAARGVAVREYPLKWGPADYLLFIDRQAVGVIEAKRQGVTLTSVELQANKYSDGVPDGVPAPIKPLPFLYQSTGVESRFTNRLDPECRSRRVFHFHQPGTLADWVAAESVWLPHGHRLNNAPAGLRLRLQQLPVRARLVHLSNGDVDLHFALRRNLFKELTYDERSKPMERRALKRRKTAEQGGKCAICQSPLPARGAVLDRFEAMKGYIASNVRVLCPICDTSEQEGKGYA